MPGSKCFSLIELAKLLEAKTFNPIDQEKVPFEKRRIMPPGLPQIVLFFFERALFMNCDVM